MAQNYNLLKGDFHLHTLHSDNMEKMDVSDYVNLAKEYELDVLCITDHHHNLTQESWNELNEKIKSHTGSPLIMSGYEITLTKGHMVFLNKDVFDSEYIDESLKNLYNNKNLRIMAHPDNNDCRWQLNLVPGIDGIEILNGGHDALSYKEYSICNGLKTYKEYLLLRHKIAAFANTDCHYSFTFGKAWTGVFISQYDNISKEAVIEAIKAGHTYSSAGNIMIELYSGDVIMGDTLHYGGGSEEIHWKCSQDAEVTLYYGDKALDTFYGSEGTFKPMMNGPYWIYVRRGNAWAVSSPIWVTGIKNKVSDENIRNKLLTNGIIHKSNEMVKHDIKIIKKIISDYRLNETKTYADDYINWLKGFTVEIINDEEFVNKSIDFVFDENIKRLKLADKILKNLINELLLKIDNRNANHLTLYNFDDKDFNGIIQTEISLKPDTKDFYLTVEDGGKLNFVSMVMKDNTFINQERTPERMKEVVLWLRRGEMHEYKVMNVVLEERDNKLLVSYDLYPAYYVEKDISWTEEAKRLQNSIKNNLYKTYILKVRTMKKVMTQFKINIGANSIKRIFIKEEKEDKDNIGQRYNEFFNSMYSESNNEYIFTGE